MRFLITETSDKEAKDNNDNNDCNNNKKQTYCLYNYNKTTSTITIMVNS